MAHPTAAGGKQGWCRGQWQPAATSHEADIRDDETSKEAPIHKRLLLSPRRGIYLRGTNVF